MASFKDLMKAFLYEDIDEDEEEIVPQEEPVKTVSAPVQNINTAPVQSTPVQTATQSASVSDVLKSATAENIMPAANTTPAQNTSIFEGLDMADISKAEPTKPQKSVSYRYERRKAPAPVRRMTGNEEYQAVISPIFGNVADEHKEFEAVHDAINLPKPEEGFDMTTVISPMYGSSIPASTPVTSIPSYKVKKKKAAPEKEKEKEKETKKISSVADFLVKESVPAPVKKAEEEPKQESLAEEK